MSFLTTPAIKQKGYLFFSVSVLFNLSSFSQSQLNERAEWFVDARFGMFIHWGVYSGAEGYWKGEKLRNDNDYAEWIYYRNRIEKKEYLSLLERFDWNSVDPEQWVLLAKRSGMKYVTITAKHHDGFALWDSKVSDYDIADYTDPKRDIVKELAAACKKHGLKLGLYYSHWVDWEHPYGWDHTKEIHPISANQYDRYWQEKVIPQMRELLTGYGPIGLIWFDMWVHHSNTIVTREQLVQLKTLIRELQPECLVNSRLGLSVEEDSDVDFRTLGDNELGDKKLDYPWQSPGTVAHSWGYHATDTQWKSTTALLKALVNNVSLNGNFMLNIGPRGNGDVPYEITQRMLEMGQWLDVNGGSIYGSEAFNLRKDQHDWGKITYKSTENGRHKLYLHVFNWPYHHKLYLTGVVDGPISAYVLGDKQKAALSYRHDHVYTEIDLPILQPDPYIPVVVLEYEQKPDVMDGLVAKTVDGGYSLSIGNMNSRDGSLSIIPPDKRGTVPEHILVEKDYVCSWKIFVDEPGKIVVSASYSFQGEQPNGSLAVRTANSVLTHDVKPTGKTVGEPNQNWHIDNFVSHDIGSIDCPDPGIYEIFMEIDAKKDPIKFQWLWLRNQTE